MKKLKYTCVLILLVLINFTCCKDKNSDVPVFIQESFSFNSSFSIPEQEDKNIEDFPVAGILSHHLLTAAMIDSWFRKLAELRTVQVFFILSPAHYDISTQIYSLTYGKWKAENGTVDTENKITGSLLDSLDLKPEPDVFYNEHGILSFIWFIKKYFPKAEIAVLAYRGEPPVNMKTAEKLSETLLPYFDSKNRKKNFLLISSDFAHHNNIENTAMKDTRTRKFFENPGTDTWIFAGCDNRPGIFVLAGLSDTLNNPEMHIMYHSNSLEISGRGEDDITSYFFTFLTEKES